MKFNFAPDISEKIKEIVKTLEMGHIDANRIVCMRSYNSKSRAYARIWSLSRVWQMALNVEAHYVIEVLSEKFDPMEEEEKEKTLIHELMHIPKTFSGALVPHLCFGKRINYATASKLHKDYKSRKANRSSII